MLGFAIERDLQTLQSQAKAGSHLSNPAPAFLMLHSPRADHRNVLALCVGEDGPDPPVIPRADTIPHPVGKVLGLACSECVDIQDKY